MALKAPALPDRQTLRRTLARWRPWLRKGGFALVDRLLFAGTNFIANILLARWMDAEQYGAFATAYALFLLLSTFHTALLAEPMMIFGSGKYAARFRRYLAFGYYGHTVISLAGSAILLLAGALALRLGPGALGAALLGMALAAPFILLLWLLRQLFYVVSRPQWAAAGGLLYLAVMVAGLYGVDRLGLLSSFAAFGVMGLSALVTDALFTRVLRPQWRAAAGDPAWRAVLADHRGYGKWSAATAGLSWLPGNIYYAVLPIWVGLEGSAALKAMQNLIMPVLLTISAVGLVVLPEFVRTLEARGKAGLNRSARSILTLLLAASAAYWVALTVARGPLVHWLYDGRYDAYADLVVIVGLLPIGTSIIAVFGNMIRASERPDLTFRAHVGSSLVTLTVGLGLAAILGVSGSVYGQILATLTTGVLMVWLHVKPPLPDRRVDRTDSGAL